MISVTHVKRHGQAPGQQVLLVVVQPLETMVVVEQQSVVQQPVVGRLGQEGSGLEWERRPRNLLRNPKKGSSSE
jgi:hypothetical protein